MQLPSDDRWVAPELVPPRFIPEHHRVVVARQQRPPEFHPDPEHVEVVVGHELRKYRPPRQVRSEIVERENV